MRKWSFQLATGKDRPLSVLQHPNYPYAFIHNYFHTSNPHPQDAVPDPVARYKPAPPLNRAQRLRASTQEVENLYYQHAAIGTPTAGHSDTSQQVPQSSGARYEHMASPRDPKLGVPLSKLVLEGELSRGTDHPRPPFPRPFVREQKVAVDARNFAASPNQKPDNGRFTMGRAGPIDARSLGARPEQQPTDGRYAMGRTDPTDVRGFAAGPKKQPDHDRFMIGRTAAMDERSLGARPLDSRDEPRADVPNLEPRISRRDTVGLEEKERFPTRQRSVQGPNRRPDRGASSSSPVAVQSGRTRRPLRNNKGEAFVSGGPRNEVVPVWNEEEEEYIKQKQEKEAGQSVDFQPARVTLDTLSGLQPAVLSGVWGMGGVLSERLMLAKQHREGQHVVWQSKEQQADVMTLVRRLKGINQRAMSGQQSEESSSAAAEVEQQTQSLLQKLLGGQYEFSKPQQERDVLGHVARHADRNESYFPDDQRSLLEKVKTLLPQDGGRKSGQRMMSEGKA